MDSHKLPCLHIVISWCLNQPMFRQVLHVFLFQSSPKGPTIPYKPQQFSVPPPSPNSPTLSCQSDNSMIMSSSNSTNFVSPPPPPVGGCPAPGPTPSAQVPMTIDSIQVLPPMFQPQPLMSPQPFMSPCVRYTSYPALGQQTMFSLAMPDQAPIKGGPVATHAPGPGPAPLQFQQVPEVSVSNVSIPQGPPWTIIKHLIHFNIPFNSRIQQTRPYQQTFSLVPTSL